MDLKPHLLVYVKICQIDFNKIKIGEIRSKSLYRIKLIKY